MLRIAASKVMWVGRATVFLVGLAVILALVFGVASTAMGANGGNFLLGKKNVASAVSTLVKQGPGPALNLMVQSGQPPLKVNSDKKVAKLNADKLDNLDQSAFLRTNGKATDADKLDGKDSADFYTAGSKVADSDTLDGKDSAAFAQTSGFDASLVLNAVQGPLPKAGTYTSKGGTLLIMARGSAFRSSANTQRIGLIKMVVVVDGTEYSGSRVWLMANERDSHKPLTVQVPVKNLPAGPHTIQLKADYQSNCNTAQESVYSVCTTTDSSDYFDVSVLEIPD